VSSRRRVHQRISSNDGEYLLTYPAAYTALSVDFDSLQVGPLIRSPSISTLPPELLRQIIETSTASWTGSPTTQTRQTILSQLSLVSSHFQSIAQPLLFEVVGLHQDRQVERWLDVMKKLGTRHVILGLATTNFSLELLISLSCLRSLTLFTNATFMSEHEFDLAILSTCPSNSSFPRTKQE
jgi:hypothetical protein